MEFQRRNDFAGLLSETDVRCKDYKDNDADINPRWP